MIYASDLSVLIDGVDQPLIRAMADPLSQAVVISLFTWRRAEPDDALPDGATRHGWWGDTTATAAHDRIGSRLWLLAREALVPETLRRARDYAVEALTWMVEDGVCTAVDVQAERSGLSGLRLRVSLTRADGGGRALEFSDIWGALHG